MTPTPEDAKRADAEHGLILWAGISHSRDRLVREAYAAGLSKYRIHQITRIGRSTIDRILTRTPQENHSHE